MLEFLKEKKVIIGVILCLIVLSVIYIFHSNNEYQEIEESQEILIKENSEEKGSETNENEDKVVVHITGAVKTPGVVKLENGSRVEDAINAAGGLTDDADISNINLAYIIEDGTKIKIPRENEENGGIFEGLSTEEDDKRSKDGKININTATQSELETLNGIGPSLAAKIVEYRNTNGKFKKIEDIKNVAGIGDNKYEEIEKNIKI